MMRKFAVALSLAGVLGASVVNALGLGEASVKSTLNQPLNAEIELVNIRGLENNEILPGMASREDFLKAGVERIYFLSDIRFDVEVGENGRAVVKLTTNKPVREPFLNFLVEVIWPSGRLLREYALLIDPPVYGDEPLAPVQQVVTAPVSSTSSPASTSVPSQQSAAQDTGGYTGGTYGPTTGKDTMWAIALTARPDSSVSAQQTMLAIQDLNPGSFINGNINTLKKGQILRLPTLNEIRQRSKRDAVRGVIAQNRAFENKTAGKNVVDGTAAKRDAGTTVAGSSAPETVNELKLVVDDSATSEGKMGAHAGDKDAGTTEELENNLAITLEKLDQSDLERNELGGRVKDLEGQLETLQRLLTLKDDQLATLQSQMGKAPEEVVVVDELSVGEVAPVEGATVDEMAAEGAASTETLTESRGTTSQPAIETVAVEEDATIITEPLKPEAAVKEVEVSAPVEEEQTAVNKPISQNILQMVLSNPLYQALTGGIVLFVLVVVWLLSRKNAQREQALYESQSEAVEVSDADVNEETYLDTDIDADESYTDGDVDNGSQASLQSETDDVIAEADIYIAYGRLDQASQLLENAISSEPQRTDIRIKLLDVYAEANEGESFAKQFNEIEALNDEDALSSALEIKERFGDADIGLSIDDLESELLAGDADTSGLAPIEYETTEVEAPFDEDDDSLMPVVEAGAESGLDIDVPEVAQDELDIEFDISEIDLDSIGATEEEEEIALSFDLDDADLDVTTEEVLPETAEALVDDQELLLGEDLELDGTLKGDESLQLSAEVEGIELSVEDVDSDNFDDIDLDLGLDVESEASVGALGENISDELSDEFNLELTSKESPNDSLDELEDGDFNLDNLDLELDKIDSELDVNFGEPEESVDLSEIDIEDVDVTEVTVDDIDAEHPEDELMLSDGLESLEIDDSLAAPISENDNVVEELEQIASALTIDDEIETGEEVVSESIDNLDIDEGLIESAEDSMAELGEFEAELAEDEDFDFLAGTDEAATKLDLARAYIDMGDSDGAKDILEEVALEGSEAQKLEAQELIKTLD